MGSNWITMENRKPIAKLVHNELEYISCSYEHLNWSWTKIKSIKFLLLPVEFELLTSSVRGGALKLDYFFFLNNWGTEVFKNFIAFLRLSDLTNVAVFMTMWALTDVWGVQDQPVSRIWIKQFAFGNINRNYRVIQKIEILSNTVY